MRVLVTGSEGQLGQDVILSLKNQGIDFLGADKDTMDITDSNKVHQVFKSYQPDVVVHCAAYTAVDQAEKDKEVCYAINVLGTKNLALSCKEFKAKMVYISTDYVFDGEGEDPFKVTDQPDPINYYGQTKYEGELEVKNALSAYFILRISWVFGLYGNNFVKTMLRLGKIKDEISVVSDQMGSPTYTSDVAQMILNMIKTDDFGTYHQTNQGICSWAEFATAIFKKEGIDCKVNPILTKDYPTAAKRPLNSRLETKSTFELFDLEQRTWEIALDEFLIQCKEMKN